MKKIKIPRLEIEVDLGKLQNPKLKMIVKDREQDFLFNYGDHDDHNERHGEHSEYDNHKEYGDHTDQPKRCHIDHGGRKRSPSHTDRMVDRDYTDDYFDHADYD